MKLRVTYTLETIGTIPPSTAVDQYWQGIAQLAPSYVLDTDDNGAHMVRMEISSIDWEACSHN